MSTKRITNPGRKLRDELNEALGSESGGNYIPFHMLPTVSLLANRAARHHHRCERACCDANAWGDAWDAGTERLEASIRELAESLPGIKGVNFQGDPRGCTVRLQLSNGRSNTWGDDGWGI